MAWNGRISHPSPAALFFFIRLRRRRRVALIRELFELLPLLISPRDPRMECLKIKKIEFHSFTLYDEEGEKIDHKILRWDVELVFIARARATQKILFPFRARMWFSTFCCFLTIYNKSQEKSIFFSSAEEANLTEFEIQFWPIRSNYVGLPKNYNTRKRQKLCTLKRERDFI